MSTCSAPSSKLVMRMKLSVCESFSAVANLESAANSSRSQLASGACTMEYQASCSFCTRPRCNPDDAPTIDSDQIKGCSSMDVASPANANMGAHIGNVRRHALIETRVKRINFFSMKYAMNRAMQTLYINIGRDFKGQIEIFK